MSGTADEVESFRAFFAPEKDNSLLGEGSTGSPGWDLASDAINFGWDLLKDLRGAARSHTTRTTTSRRTINSPQAGRLQRNSTLAEHRDGAGSIG